MMSRTAGLVALGAIGLSLYLAGRKPKDLRLHLPMNEGSGSMVYDHSRYGNDGEIIGGEWLQLANGLWVLNFNGESDYVDCGNNSSLNNRDGNLAIEVWVRRGSFGAEEAIVTHWGEWSGRFKLSFNTDGTLLFNFRSYTPDSHEEILYSSSNISDFSWHHIAVVANCPESTIGFYIDGQLDAMRSVIYSMNIGTQPLQIGAMNVEGIGFFYPFAGLISEVRIYNRALTPDEIREHYSLLKPLYEGI